MLETLLLKIGTAVAVVGLAIGGWFGYAPEPNVGASFQTPEVRALFETTLASSITSSATSFTLTSATDIDGTSLASSTYGFIFDEGTASQEIVLADCTGTTCTNATRGLSGRTGTTTVSALQFSHRRGASVKITDAPALIFAMNVLKGTQNLENVLTYNSNLAIATSSNQLAHSNYLQSNYVDKWGTQTITGTKTFSATSTLTSGALVSTAYRCTSSSDNNQLCEKAYIDGVAVAGASNANETTKGIVEMATVAEINANTQTGGTGARLTIDPAFLAVSRYASNTINYKASTSTPSVANATMLAATTTTVINGEKLLIFATCGYSNRIGLYVKPAGSATTTIAGGIGASASISQVSLFGIYTATASESIEIYLGTDITGGAGNYLTTCTYPSFMWLRFDR